MSDILLVQQAANATPAQTRYLKDAASTTLDLIAAAKVSLHTHIALNGSAAIILT